MPTVLPLVADGGQNTGGFSSLEDGDNLVGFRATEIWLDKLIAPSFRSFQDGCIPNFGTILNPIVILLCDLSQNISAYRVLIAIATEEPDHSFGLLEGLNKPVE